MSLQTNLVAACAIGLLAATASAQQTMQVPPGGVPAPDPAQMVPSQSMAPQAMPGAGYLQGQSRPQQIQLGAQAQLMAPTQAGQLAPGQPTLAPAAYGQQLPVSLTPGPMPSPMSAQMMQGQMIQGQIQGQMMPNQMMSAQTAGQMPPVPAPAAEEAGSRSSSINPLNGQFASVMNTSMMNPADASMMQGDAQCCPSGGCQNGIDVTTGYPMGMGDGCPLGMNEGSGFDQPGVTTGGGCCPPRWYFRGDAVWLKRDQPNDRNLTILNNTDPKLNRFILRTDDTTFNSVAGMRLTLGHYLNEQLAIEGGFFGTHDWHQKNSTPLSTDGQGNGLLSPYWGSETSAFDTTAFFASSKQIATYDTRFNSAEINLRKWAWPTTSFLGGFRYLSIKDQFQLFAFHDPTLDPTNVGFYRTSTTNNLFGGQFGSEYTHQIFVPWLFFACEAKGGAFANVARQENQLFNSTTTNDRRSERETTFARMGDLSVGLTAMAGSHLTLRAGYTYVYVSGLALATDQLDTSPVQSNSRQFIADKGSINLHGPYVGGELVW